MLWISDFTSGDGTIAIYHRYGVDQVALLRYPSDIGGQEDDPNYEHVCRGHMELETTLEFLKVNKSMDLRNVVLLHLSDDNSDAEMFAARAKEVVGMADVYVADKEMEIELNKEPF